MRNKSTLLVIALPLLLGSCNNSASIRPQSSDDTVTTSASIINPTSIISSISAGIGSIELQNTIDTAKLVTDKIRTSSIDFADEIYAYPNGLSEKPTKEEYSLVEKDKLYDNSVRVASYNSTSLKNSQHFHYADEDGKFIAHYTYIDDAFKNIKINLVTQQENVAITKVKEAYSFPYSLKNYDAQFTILNSSLLIDAIGNEDKVELAGKLDSGDVYVRFLVSSTESINPQFSMKQIDTIRQEFFYKNSNISKINTFYESRLISDDSIEYMLSISTVSQTFSISTNGNYDKSAIPMPESK